MSTLKLAALDEEDLNVVSAHVQDAVVRSEDFVWMPGENRFVAALNRFVWEEKPRFFWQKRERRRAALQFDRVTRAGFTGFTPGFRGEVLALLAIRFVPAEPPAGVVELIFSAGAGVRLEVECIEARLTDLGAAWSASATPKHGA